MFGFRQNNRKRQSTRQQMRGVGERIAGLGRRILPVIFLIAIAIGVPFGVFQAYLKTVSGDYFALQKIEVTGLAHLDEQRALERTGLVAGRNIFDIDLQRAERILRSRPWVRDVQLERRLPDQVRVHITEYEPAAVLVGAGYWLISADGVVFASIEPTGSLRGLLSLPMVSGLELVSDGTRRGQKLRDKTLFFEVLEVVRLYESMGLTSWEAISEIHVDPTLGLTLVSADTGVEVRLGRGQYAARLERLKVVQRSIAQRAMEVDYILIDQEKDLSRVAVGRRHGPRVGFEGKGWDD